MNLIDEMRLTLQQLSKDTPPTRVHIGEDRWLRMLPELTMRIDLENPPPGTSLWGLQVCIDKINRERLEYE